MANCYLNQQAIYNIQNRMTENHYVIKHATEKAIPWLRLLVNEWEYQHYPDVIRYEPVFDLDAVSYNVLAEFWAYIHAHHQYNTLANLLFPGKRRGHLAALKGWASYAINKALALKHQEQGNEEYAKQHLDICEAVYNRLPKFAQWRSINVNTL